MSIKDLIKLHTTAGNLGIDLPNEVPKQLKTLVKYSNGMTVQRRDINGSSLRLAHKRKQIDLVKYREGVIRIDLKSPEGKLGGYVGGPLHGNDNRLVHPEHPLYKSLSDDYGIKSAMPERVVDVNHPHLNKAREMGFDSKPDDVIHKFSNGDLIVSRNGKSEFHLEDFHTESPTVTDIRDHSDIKDQSDLISHSKWAAHVNGQNRMRRPSPDGYPRSGQSGADYINHTWDESKPFKFKRDM